MKKLVDHISIWTEELDVESLLGDQSNTDLLQIGQLLEVRARHLAQFLKTLRIYAN